MKKILSLLVTIVLNVFCASAQNIYDSIYVDTMWRTYMTHLPDGYDNAAQYPLVLAFHGGQAGNASLGWFALAYQSELSQKADSAGFIVVYPEGSVFNNNRTWNAGDCCPPAMNQAVDDVAFVDHLLDTLMADYAIDTARVYAAGSSNGGMMCYRLACDLSERIAAIATNACSQMYFPCEPSREVPVIHFQSYADTQVLYEGGIGDGLLGINMTSQDATMDLWRTLNNCLLTDTLVNGNGVGYDFIRIHGCGCATAFHQYNTTDGGHSWPGGNDNNNPASTQLSATYLLWDFFQNYTLACEGVAVNDQPHPASPLVYPNPVLQQLHLAHLKGMVHFTLKDLQGKTVLTGQADRTIDLGGIPAGIYLLTLGQHPVPFRIIKA
jgi:polyhydroxybutyrate depolymerase